jgi:hypothetical protein
MFQQTGRLGFAPLIIPFLYNIQQQQQKKGFRSPLLHPLDTAMNKQLNDALGDGTLRVQVQQKQIQRSTRSVSFGPGTQLATHQLHRQWCAR